MTAKGATQARPHPLGTLVSMELTHPGPARLQWLFKAIDFSKTVLPGDGTAMKLTIGCPRGRIVFRS